MRIWLFICLVASHAHALVDGPDLDQESRFHQIYQNYNLNPTSSEAWSSQLTSDKPNTYTIQSGDNLWNLSETFFADPYFWPKIWSLNNEAVQNPHEVKPNQILKFTPGTTGEAPSVELAAASKDTETAAEIEEKPELIFEKAEKNLKPKKALPPAKIPPSVPGWSLMVYNDPTLDLKLSTLRSNYRAPDPILSHYLTDEEIEGVGEVRDTELGYKTSAQFQELIVRLKEAKDFKTFVVVKPIDRVPDPEKGRRAYLVQVQGQIELIEVVDERRDLYRARVLKSLYPIEVGDKLAPISLSQYSPTPTQEYGKAEASIVGGTISLSQSIFSIPSTVVLNAGTAQGLVPGQMLKIYKNPEVRNPKTRIKNTTAVIGRLKILQSSSNMSVGLITESDEEIWLGDSTEPIVR